MAADACRCCKRIFQKKPMLRHRPRGSAATEVALVMTLLACGLLITYSRLGGQTQQMMSRLDVAGFTNSSDSGKTTDSSLLKQEQEAPPSLPLDNRVDDVPMLAILLSFLAAIGFLAIGLLVDWRTRKRTVPVSQEVAAEPLAKICELPEALFTKRQTLLHLFEQMLPAFAEIPATVDLVMTPRVSSVGPETKLEDLRKLMKQERLRHLLVCDKQGKLLGVISDRDLSKQGATADQIMSKSPVSVSSTMSLITAVTMLINRRFSSLPVVEDGRPVGILTTTDILLALQAMVMLLQKQ